MNPHSSPLPHQRLSRRQVIQMFAAASAATGAAGLPSFSFGAEGDAVAATGYGTDPVLAKIYTPGEVWPLILTEPQRRTVTALCDVILPADDLGPAASAVGVPEFLDEWVSAPYPDQVADRPVILQGLEWLEKESMKRFNKSFADLDETQQHTICDDICDPDKATPEFKAAARFFLKFRGLAAGGYYCTQEGWKAIGFVGNLTSATFDGPPPAVLKLLEVEQTVA